MADIITTRPKLPPPSPTPGNVSTLTSPNIVANVKSSKLPQAFGDQVKDTSKQQIIAGSSQSTIAKLYKEKADLIEEEIKLNYNHQLKLQQLQQQNQPTKKVVNGQTVDGPPALSNEEYEKAVVIEEANYQEAKKNIETRKKENQKAIDDYLKDPFKKQKEELKKREKARVKSKSKNKASNRKAKRDKTKAIIKNGAKAIAPVIGVLLSNRILEVISQNNKLQKLVDDTNAIIEAANISNDPIQLNNARITRDNAVKVIERNEQRIIRINKLVETFTRIATILSGIITAIQIILSLPFPPLIPLKIKLQPILQRISQILALLIGILASVLVGLQSVIQRLADLKAQLLNINGEIDNAAANTIPNNLNSALGLQFGTADYGEYKGFKFALREEKDPKFEVRGNKRHFAVAINRRNIEQLKSEPSFTLDPNDLIEQLKLVIDQQNLQG